jgi:hypothetical protein
VREQRTWMQSLPEFLEEMDLFSELKEEIFYCFYNVIWIEWEDNIAYRKALGRAFKKAWESQNLEEVDIMLG